MARDDSKCPKDLLCDFDISRDLEDALIEICNKCGKKVVYNKINGRVDDSKYLRDHLRHTLQPFGRTRNLFLKIYGIKSIERVKQWEQITKKKAKQKKIREELHERRKFLYGGKEPPKLIKKTKRIKR